MGINGFYLGLRLGGHSKLRLHYFTGDLVLRVGEAEVSGTLDKLLY